MFKLLKRRMLLMNIVLIIFIMSVAFSAVYLITYNRTHDMINKMLNDVEGRSLKSEPMPEPLESAASDKPLPDRIVAFTINVNSDGETLSVLSRLDENHDFYDMMKTKVLNSTEDGQLKIDEVYWSYRLVDRGEYLQIYYVDATPLMVVLNRLIITFLLVAVFMLIVIYYVSNYLTNRSIKPIKEAFERQHQFISDASHELKTPLAVIQSNVDVLMSNEPGEDKVWLDYIHREVKRMTSLTEDLLDLSRLENMANSNHFKTFSLSQICEETALELEAIAFEKAVELNYHISPQIEFVGHPCEIKQLIMILLDNALKYTDDLVQFDLSLHHQQLCITVKNTGEVIPEPLRDKIFDRFYKVDTARTEAKEGYGLGLSIAQMITHRHHGKITYEVEGEWNVFRVTFNKK